MFIKKIKILILIFLLISISSEASLNGDNIIISEVGYYPSTALGGSAQKNEWFELYNPTANSIDISGWTFTDNEGTVTVPNGLIINSGEYFIATHTATAGELTEHPSVVVDLEYGSIDVGSVYFSNVSDELVLKDSSGVLVDETSWGGGANYNISTTQGNTITRATSTDTDLETDWLSDNGATPGSGNLTLINNSPININVSSNSVDENTSAGSNIAILSTTDVDGSNVHTYSFVAGVGDEDNDKFQIGTGADIDKLKLNFTPNFEAATDLGDVVGNNTYSIRIQTDDGNGGIFQKSFIITVNDINEAPLITDTAFSVDENSVNGTTVGTQLGTDVDTSAPNNTLTYSITAGNTNNAFSINPTTAEITVNDSNELDFETTPVYNLTVEVSDGEALTDTADITVNINDLDDNIPVIGLIGANPQVIEVGTVYTELGAAANDNVDGDISGNIIIDYSNVIVGTIGLYSVTYNVADTAGNNAIEVSRIVNIVSPATSGHSGKSHSRKSGKKVCKDSKALNFSNVGQHNESLCKYTEEEKENSIENVENDNKCPASQTLTQNMKAGDRNGRYSNWEKGIITEVKILQTHMNRLGFNSGPVDGILGPITEGAIKRMQIHLKFTGNLIDGYVGHLTRERINNSCK